MRRAQHAKRLRRHYAPLLEEHGTSFRAVDWGSAQGQALRFRMLLDVGDWRQASILDVGCGVGHLAGHLAVRKAKGRYLGIDMLPEMIERARARYPRRHFAVGDILDSGVSWKADYVLSSGSFTFTDAALMKRSIAAMFAACRRGVAFNALSAWSKRRQTDEFHADPLTTLAFCRRLTPKLVLRHDYLPHDFTVYLYR